METNNNPAPLRSQADVPKGWSRKTKIITAVLVVLGLLAIAVVWLWRTGKIGYRQVAKPIVQTSNNVLNLAKNGNLIDGFDQKFIIDSQAKITDSAEAKSTRSGYKRLVTFYESSLSVGQLTDGYNEFFGEDGWKLMGGSILQTQSNMFAARSATGETLQINIIAVPQQNKSVVQVEFFKKINP